MNKRSRRLSVLVACCLVLQGLLSWVLPLQSGMLMAAELEAVEIVTEPAAPPCHPANAAAVQPVAAHDPGQGQEFNHHHEHDEDCCEQASTHCSNLCYWACAFTPAAPQAVAGRLASRLAPAPAIVHLRIPAPWVPPIPIPPPIQSATAPA